MKEYFIELLERYPELKNIKKDILQGYQQLENTFHNSGKLLIAGNGGSAADADHIVAELMKGFQNKRRITNDFAKQLVSTNETMGDELAAKLQRALPAISLCNHTALTTAYANDVDGKMSYAQQLYAYGNEKDTFLALSTSGNSENILYAAITAKSMGMKLIGLTGDSGGKLSNIADFMVRVPQIEAYRVQELHLPIYHCWCLMLEQHFFNYI